MESTQTGNKHLANFGIIDRQSVRAFVGEYTKKLEIAKYCGDNIHQLALDQQDKVDHLVADWLDEEKTLFLKLYAEEITAYNNSKLDEVNSENARATQQHIQNAQNASTFATWISIIVFFAILISFIKMMK